MSIGYWCIRNPWDQALALDEFGNGTLDGNPADGASFDGCSAAAIENAAAAYASRLPTYSNIGTIRADMISNGQWTAGATVSNPRTSGAVISNVAWELPRRGFDVLAFKDYDAAGLTEADIRTAIGTPNAAAIFIVTNAQALVYNELGVHGHFVATVGYGGDLPDGSTGKQYILNSDVSGQHGTGTGQWTDLRTFLNAQPCGYVVFRPHPVTPPAPVAPPEPPEDEQIQTALAALASIQQQETAAAAAVAAAQAALVEPQNS